jgi:hypothetical protein
MLKSAAKHVLVAAMILGGCGSDSSGNKTGNGNQQPGDGDGAGKGDGDASGDGDSTKPGDGDSSNPGDGDSSNPGDGDASDPGAGAALVGHYAMIEHSAATADALGMKLKSAATSYGLVEITQAGGKLGWKQSSCHVEVVNDPASNELTVADAVTRSVDALVSELKLTGSGAELTWERPEASVATGFHDTDPSMPIPADKSDARVFDQDGDGHPGFTAHVKGTVLAQTLEGDVYNVQRLTGHLTGKLDGKRLVGEGFEATDAKTLEATNPLLSALQLTTMRDASGDNSLLLVPVDASLDCDALLTQKDTLFK